MKPTLLIVDDEKTQREGLRAVLEGHYEVYLAEDSAAATELLEREHFDILLTDFRMPREDGLKLIARAKSLGNSPACILMTAYGSEELAVEAMKHGADDYISKGGMLIEALEKKIATALRLRSLEEENQILRQQLDRKFGLEHIAGDSPAMRQVFDVVRQVAPSSASVLILGESGTGKELIAKAIHQLSPRAHKSLVAVHCAGLPSTLLESELFGHEKGAYTGAHERRIGKFEQAHGGTLFLDEIGEIDGTIQVKLLRVLGERTFERLGSNRTIKVDTRLVAATNRELRKRVEEGRFRGDLYYRLRVVEIHLPPLRERRGDLPGLAQTFLREFAKQNEKNVVGFAPEALEALLRHSWPGNVRELRSAVEHAVIFSRRDHIAVHDLPETLREASRSGTQTMGAPFAELRPNFSITDHERQLILHALEQTGGNRTEAARLLGMSRRTLHRKLHRFQLQKLDP